MSKSIGQETNAQVAARWERFCERSERAGLKCKPCAAACCHLKGAEQIRYKGFNVSDTVMVCEDKSGQIVVESDIEIPFPVDPRKSGDVRTLMAQKKTMLSLEVGRRVEKMQDEGIKVTGPWFHQHYNANRLPEIGALHVHVRAMAPDVMTGRKLAERIWKEIDQPRLTKLIE